MVSVLEPRAAMGQVDPMLVFPVLRAVPRHQERAGQRALADSVLESLAGSALVVRVGLALVRGWALAGKVGCRSPSRIQSPKP